MSNVTDAVYCHTIGMPEWNNNPFISALGAYRTDDELYRALYYNPYAGRDFAQTGNHLRDAQIDKLVAEAYVVTTKDLMLASAVQRMLWTGLDRRPPVAPATWQDLAKFSEAAKAGVSIDAIPWRASWADAGNESEITGMGKTHRLRRILALWHQAIAHRRVPGMPWEEYHQVVWLYLDMTFNGSLSGLLLHMLNEVDRALDNKTKYAIEYPKRARNVQQLQVWVIDVLKRHFCGLIVLDELQAISLLKGVDPELVGNFFLRLLNQGIPTIAMGNPFAFAHYRTNAQIWDRFTAVALPSLRPGGYDDEEARDKFVPGLWTMQVMPTVSKASEGVKQAIFECSAWHPRHVVRAVQNGQRVALATGKLETTADHIRSGFLHCVAAETQRRIHAFVSQRAELLLPWKDIPTAEFAAVWGETDESVLKLARRHDDRIVTEKFAGDFKQDQQAKSEGDPPVADKGTKVTLLELAKRERARVKRQVKKMMSEKATQMVTNPALAEDDLRRAGLRGALAEAHAKGGTMPKSGGESPGAGS